ncbi:DUF262 domain-containing protein [Brachyspira pilosicoli]|uniref:DUF262 domain-containing protein n=1 Tax=Brachyspira pilosicoli TaxID=52584 RepID=UPI003007BFD2
MSETSNQENSNKPVEMRTVKDLLDNNYNFVIPSYQRGYRWDEIQVKDLLNDICEFNQNNDEGFYCLQPLVLKKISDEKKLNELGFKYKNNVYEVIDGQQRLTTIYLILKYLKSKKIIEKNIYTITYSTRTDSKRFLEETLTDKELSKEDITHIDFEYIYNAYNTIKDWFNSDEKKKIIKNILLSDKIDKKSVQFIWYEPSNNANAIEIFTRINIGKIPLTNSELIKALFLQKANFKHDKNFDEALYEHTQIEIASEWDYIENTLQDNRFWGFINNDMDKKYNRIDYIFEIVSNKLKGEDKKLSDEGKKAIGDDNYKTFRYFYKKWKDNENKMSFMQDIWKEIRYCFYAMSKWYNDLTFYHYIGYIIYFSNKKVERFSNIYNLYTDKIKNQFVEELKKIIKEEIINDIYINELNYEKEKDKLKIRKILLLYNIEYMLKNKSSNSKFPFDLFKGKTWDIEHIDPRTTNNLIKKEDKKDWLKIAMEDYNIDNNIKSDIEKYLDDDNNKNFEELYDSIVKSLFDEEDKDNEIDRDLLYNLTLLDSHTNRSYGNAFFKSKRKRIIEEDKKGNFIPICTKNIFLKYFNLNASTIYKYTKDDAEAYKKDLYETLKEFLPNLSKKENL